MHSLFELTSHDISNLSEEDLRTLLAKLCEADFRKANMSTSSITWGGHQNAVDGGVDVRVKCKKLPSNTYVPRPNTIFQVKKADLTARQVAIEMKPKKKLRPAIADVMKKKGAYVLTSGNSISDLQLNNRIKEMKKVLLKQFGTNTHVAFFDASRLASWAREHPAIVFWIQLKVNNATSGWQTYGEWTPLPLNMQRTNFILDDQLRMFSSSDPFKKVDTKTAIINMRSYLIGDRVSIRLIGLSGLGKTRLVQALFENNVIPDALNPDLAIFCDYANSPQPGPIELIQACSTLGYETILVVDNCSSDLHFALTQACKKSISNVRLVTIEYDIRDDRPHDTQVWRLLESTDSTIESILRQYYPAMAEPNLRTISKFSGGNARIALALANATGNDADISVLNDEALFQRLFYQRNTVNEGLLNTAETCALVYSFSAGDSMAVDSEIQLLSSLAHLTPEQLYRQLSTLKDRGLLQSRGQWRAVLPQAIANRLAGKALNGLPVDFLLTKFTESGRERLLKSFAKRIGYLADSSQAEEIVVKWLSADGLLGRKKGELNHDDYQILFSIAPTAPEPVITFIEECANLIGGDYTTRHNRFYDDVVNILIQLAYEPFLFKRSVDLIIRFALTEDEQENVNSIHNRLGQLFQLYLSGTLALIGQRKEVIIELISSGKNNASKLASFLLGKTLKCSNWNLYGFYADFGSKIRSYGWVPKSKKDVMNWYQTFLSLCESSANSNAPASSHVRERLSKRFRDLCDAGMYNALEPVAKMIHVHAEWSDGWIACRNTLSFSNKIKPSVRIRLEELLKFMRPKSLLQKALAVIRNNGFDHIELEDFSLPIDKTLKPHERSQRVAKEIGRLMAYDDHALLTILPEIFATPSDKTFSIGEGLFTGSNNPIKHWTMLSKDFADSKNDINLQIAIGFLAQAKVQDRGVYDQILDESLFAPFFPIFQCQTGLDLKAIERLQKTIAAKAFPFALYRNLRYCKYEPDVTVSSYIQLMKRFVPSNDGSAMVLESLYMTALRWSFDASTISEFAAEVLCQHNFEVAYSENLDHCIGQVILRYLQSNTQQATELCQNISRAIQSKFLGHFYQETLASLASMYPAIVLDVFIGENIPEHYDPLYRIANDGFNETGPLDHIADVEIIKWCKINPQKRIYSLLSKLRPFKLDNSPGKLIWKPAILELLHAADDVEKALENLRMSLIPMSYSGLRSNIYIQRLGPISDLTSDSNGKIRDWAHKTHGSLERVISQALKKEKEDRSSDERFE
ncbi:MAG: hypothetical protein WKF87_04890 [Chryseolinea sp.]